CLTFCAARSGIAPACVPTKLAGHREDIMIQWMKVAATLLVLVITPAFGASWETAGFYSAKGKLIRPGMSMQEVLADAGEPLERKSPGAKEHDPAHTR